MNKVKTKVKRKLKNSVKNKIRGFTLIEVLIVSVLVSLFFIGLPQASSNFFHQKNYMLSKYRANSVAWNQLMQQYMIEQGINRTRDRAKQGTSVQWQQKWTWKKSDEKTLVGKVKKHTVQVYSEDNPRSPASELVVFITEN